MPSSRPAQTGPGFDPRPFRWCGLSPGSPDVYFKRPAFATEDVARGAWRHPGIRRRVWGATHRLHVPRAAELYDTLSCEGFARLCEQSMWSAAAFPRRADLPSILQGIAVDRAAVAAFRVADPLGARELKQYLAFLLADLDVLERVAREHSSNIRGAVQALVPITSKSYREAR